MLGLVCEAEQPVLRKARVNRTGATCLGGRGLVDPLDDMRATNPPSNP